MPRPVPSPSAAAALALALFAASGLAACGTGPGTDEVRPVVPTEDDGEGFGTDAERMLEVFLAREIRSRARAR